MTRLVRGLLIVAVVVCSVVLCGDVDARKGVKPPHVWWASDSSWVAMGFGELAPGVLEELMRKMPGGLEGLKGYRMAYEEGGQWLGFSVNLKRVRRVTFTKTAKIVLVESGGRRVESEAIVFFGDQEQSVVLDSRKGPVVVSAKSVWCNPGNGYPSGIVKFPGAGVPLKKIGHFEVLGVVEQRDKGESK